MALPCPWRQSWPAVTSLREVSGGCGLGNAGRFHVLVGVQSTQRAAIAVVEQTLQRGAMAARARASGCVSFRPMAWALPSIGPYSEWARANAGARAAGSSRRSGHSGWAQIQVGREDMSRIPPDSAHLVSRK